MATISEALKIAIEHHQAGRLQEAEAIYRQILRLQPNNPGALHFLGLIAHQVGQHQVAVEYMQRVIKMDPKVPDYHNNLGLALQEQGRLEEAGAHYREALAINPDYAEAHLNLGNTLRELGNLNGAIERYRTALRLKPDLAEAHMSLGVAFQELGRLNEAIAQYRMAISFKPELSESHRNLALALLLSGNFTEGLKEYEWRWEAKEGKAQKRNFPQPIWNGEEISGRAILLYAEQGVGDTIQFIRYAPLVAKRGARVIVECHANLKSLLESVRGGVMSVVARGEPLPPFDVYVSLLSLPWILDTTIETIPAQVPYITANPAAVTAWRSRLESDKGRFKVGLAWAGRSDHKNDRNRSCALDLFEPLAKLPDVTFYSLQKGEAAKQAANPPGGMVLKDFTPDLNDFADTAALMTHLDLIIAVDTAVVHLAGAMGKPAWTVLPFSPDWRWMLERNDTPWYPTMRLFRQPCPGDWPGVFARVAEELQKLVGSGRPSGIYKGGV